MCSRFNQDHRTSQDNSYCEQTRISFCQDFELSTRHGTTLFFHRTGFFSSSSSHTSPCLLTQSTSLRFLHRQGISISFVFSNRFAFSAPVCFIVCFLTQLASCFPRHFSHGLDWPLPDDFLFSLSYWIMDALRRPLLSQEDTSLPDVVKKL